MTVLSLEEVRVEPDATALVTAGISQPPPGGALATASFVVRGWVLGAAARALAVEIRSGERLVRVAAVREPTPDVAGAHPDRPGAAHCGFLTRVHVRGLEPSSGLRLDAVLANGTRAAIGAIGLAPSQARLREPRTESQVPSIREDVKRLVIAEAERLGIERKSLFETPAISALDDVELEGRTVLDLSGGPGHVARAARARGAALVDSVHLDGDYAGVARLLDLYHRTTRVFVHDSLEGLDRGYDVVLMLGEESSVAPEALDALAAGEVVRR